jgi:peptidoglycan/LPS O-acetylase OafA/YrhL
MGIGSGVVSELGLLWPILAVGFVVFAIYYGGKAAAARSGRHLGVLGIGLVLVVVAMVSWWLAYTDFALLFGFIGAVLVVAGAAGRTR